MTENRKQPAGTFRARVTGRREVAAGTWETTCLCDRDFTFRAGQHALLRLPRLAAEDRRGPARVFSMCSWGPDGRLVSFAFRDTGSGFKKTMLSLSPEEELVLTAARGRFVLPEEGPPLKAVFVAGGIGITPFLSMLRRLVCARAPRHEIILHYVNRAPESAAYREELRALASRDPSFTLHEHYRREDLAAALEAVPDPAGRTWYIAGPAPMPAALREALAGRGVPAGRIVTEEFFGYGNPSKGSAGGPRRGGPAGPAGV